MTEEGRGEFFEIFDKYWSSMTWEGFYDFFYNTKLVYAEPGRIKFEFVVTDDVLNAGGSLHGGCTAALMDVLLMMLDWKPSTTRRTQGGVTVDMTIAYMNAAKLGDILVIDCQKLRSGKTLGFYRGEVYRKSDGAIIAASQHTYALIPENKAKNIPDLSPMAQRGNLKYFEAFYKYWNNRNQWEGFQEVLADCKVIFAEPGRIKYEFPVLQTYSNPVGNLHGGCAFTLLDVCLSTAIFDPNKNLTKQTGVTVTMSISYLNPAPIGEIVVIDCQKLKMDKNLAFFQGQIYRKSDGIPVAVAKQTLAVIDEKPNP